MIESGGWHQILAPQYLLKTTVTLGKLFNLSLYQYKTGFIYPTYSVVVIIVR